MKLESEGWGCQYVIQPSVFILICYSNQRTPYVAGKGDLIRNYRVLNEDVTKRAG